MIRVLRPAGFWRRGAALAMDGLWLFCTAGALSWILFGVALPGAAAAPGVASAGTSAVHQLLPAAVAVVGWWRFGATPGKVLLELRVVDARSGERPALAQALVRYLGYFVSALPLGLGFVWAAVDREKAALHDRLARTRVVVVVEEILPETAT